MQNIRSSWLVAIPFIVASAALFSPVYAQNRDADSGAQSQSTRVPSVDAQATDSGWPLHFSIESFGGLIPASSFAPRAKNPIVAGVNSRLSYPLDRLGIRMVPFIQGAYFGTVSSMSTKQPYNMASIPGTSLKGAARATTNISEKFGCIGLGAKVIEFSENVYLSLDNGLCYGQYNLTTKYTGAGTAAISIPVRTAIFTQKFPINFVATRNATVPAVLGDIGVRLEVTLTPDISLGFGFSGEVGPSLGQEQTVTGARIFSNIPGGLPNIPSKRFRQPTPSAVGIGKFGANFSFNWCSPRFWDLS